MLAEMATTDQATEGPNGRPGSGRRVLALWLCWVVLAAFLIGWRFILWLLRRNKQAAPKPKDPRRSGNPAKRAGA